MTNERDILWEGKFYWVLRSHPFRGKPVTQVMKTGSVASESVETYKPGADGESIAIARAKYLENRALYYSYLRTVDGTRSMLRADRKTTQN